MKSKEQTRNKDTKYHHLFHTLDYFVNYMAIKGAMVLIGGQPRYFADICSMQLGTIIALINAGEIREGDKR